MLYVSKSGDTLYGIAARFGTTTRAIMEANIICNPNLIFPGIPLIIPEPSLDYLPKSGGYPYYVIQYGDTLGCIASQFSQSVSSLAAANKIRDPNQIFAGSELLVGFEPIDPQLLFNEWNQTGGIPCDELSSLQIHGIYYIGTFRWEAIGEGAVPFLVTLLNHPCNIVRFYAVISLGRIGTGVSTRLALQQALTDRDPTIVELAQLSLQRVRLIPSWSKRVHLTITNAQLFHEPSLLSTGITVPKSTPIIVLRWNIPSPTGEEGPRGDIQIYDFVQITATGQTGYLPRVGFNEITMI